MNEFCGVAVVNPADWAISWTLNFSKQSMVSSEYINALYPSLHCACSSILSADLPQPIGRRPYD